VHCARPCRGIMEPWKRCRPKSRSSTKQLQVSAAQQPSLCRTCTDSCPPLCALIAWLSPVPAALSALTTRSNGGGDHGVALIRRDIQTPGSSDQFSIPSSRGTWPRRDIRPYGGGSSGRRAVTAACSRNAFVKCATRLPRAWSYTWRRLPVHACSVPQQRELDRQRRARKRGVKSRP
jgi:hypothetical protein